MKFQNIRSNILVQMYFIIEMVDECQVLYHKDILPSTPSRKNNILSDFNKIRFCHKAPGCKRLLIFIFLLKFVGGDVVFQTDASDSQITLRNNKAERVTLPYVVSMKIPF